MYEFDTVYVYADDDDDDNDNYDGGFGRNSDSDMRTFRNCDVERFEIQMGT